MTLQAAQIHTDVRFRNPTGVRFGSAAEAASRPRADITSCGVVRIRIEMRSRFCCSHIIDEGESDLRAPMLTDR